MGLIFLPPALTPYEKLFAWQSDPASEGSATAGTVKKDRYHIYGILGVVNAIGAAEIYWRAKMT